MIDFPNGFPDAHDNMRAGADWQLQVDAEWWKIILKRMKILHPNSVNSLIEEFKKAMRPQQQQQEDVTHPLTDEMCKDIYDLTCEADVMMRLAYDLAIERMSLWLEMNGYKYVTYDYELGCQSNFSQMVADFKDDNNTFSGDHWRGQQ